MQHSTSDPSQGGSHFVYVAAAVAALGGLLFGYDTGVISGAILFIKDQFSLSSSMEELVVSAVLIGAVAGAAGGGTLADRLGRRWMLIISAAIFSVGAVGTALAPGPLPLLAGRIVVGVAIGVASFTAPLYISEIAPARMRGLLVGLNQLALTSGILISYLVDYAFSPIDGWRWMLGLAAIPSLTLGIAMLFMPPSPRWLVGKGENQQASSVLRRIRGTQQVEQELQEIGQGLERQASGSGALMGPIVKPALMVGVGLAIFQQITGINTVIYYSPTIFEYAGLNQSSTAILASVIVGVTNVVFTIVAIRLVDRVGRRPLLLVGLLGMVIGLFILGLAFELRGLSSFLQYIAVGSLMLYVASFAIGLGPVFWLLISEIYPLRVRGSATSLATVANWGANLVVAIAFLTLVDAIGRPGTFWLYAGVGIGAWVFVYALVPETKGHSLEEIEEHWHQGKPPRELRAKAEVR